MPVAAATYLQKQYPIRRDTADRRPAGRPRFLRQTVSHPEACRLRVAAF
jgi:hypothetical protein